MGFDEKKVTKEIITFIKNYYHDNKMGGAVIGLSGGKDSAVCLALMAKAIGNENVLALWLPANSRKEDYKDAKKLADMFNVELLECDIGSYSDKFIKTMKKQNKTSDSDLLDASINIKPRLRMLALYSYAAMMSKIKKIGYLVIGTSNKSERFVGYCTKGGDTVSDIFPIADLYVDEVIKIGEYLGIPKEIINKTPDDGLSGLSDEEKLGFTYDDVKKVSLEYETGKYDETIKDEVREKILCKHNVNLHKFYTPMYKRRD